MPEEQTGSNSQASSSSQDKSVEITPELVKEVTEKVYALMMKDMKIARERFRSNANTYHRKGG